MRNLLEKHLKRIPTCDTYYQVGHCRVIGWLSDNFNEIGEGKIKYQDYIDYCNKRGIVCFEEKDFINFSQQKYLI